MIKSIRQFLSPPKQAVIELAGQEDFRALSDIHKACFDRGWTDGEFEALLAQDSYYCLVTRNPGKSNRTPSGFVLIKQLLDEAEIITIAVNPSFQKRGIASALMRETIRRLESDRVSNLFLDVDENNKPALSLYNKLGFGQIDKRDGYYSSEQAKGGNPSAALVMKLVLG